ncbi:MAG TPA: peptide ABC transporter substrate-binding protein, partial [Bacilli bacterium]|nr:peptide ABC transporter substrate-binding protein [Bacilli bacterium]
TQLVLGAAESVQVAEDNHEFTFRLKDNRWSDGTPVTAGDFKQAWLRVIRSDSRQKTKFAWIQGVESFWEGTGSPEAIGLEAIDDRTLQVRLKQPYPMFLSLTSSIAYLPLPQHAKEPLGFVTNGAYSLASVEAKRVVLQPKEAGKPMVQVTLNGDGEWIARQFREQAVDVADGIPHKHFQAFQEQGFVHLVKEYGTAFLFFNCRNERLQTAAVRKEIKSALDLEAIVTAAQMYEKPMRSLVPWDFHQAAEATDIVFPSEKQEKPVAKRTPNGLRLLCIKLELYEIMAHQIKRQIEGASGYQVEVVPCEFEDLMERVRQGEYELALQGWIGDYLDPMSMLEIWTSDHPYNLSGYASEEFDQRILQSHVEQDSERRTVLLQQAEALLLRDAPLIPIYQYMQPLLKQKGIKGIACSPFGLLDFSSICKQPVNTP